MIQLRSIPAGELGQRFTQPEPTVVPPPARQYNKREYSHRSNCAYIIIYRPRKGSVLYFCHRVTRYTMACSGSQVAQIDFTIPFGYSDVIFLIDEKRVHANRAVLAMSSQIFADMFEDDENEEIQIDTAEYEAFLELMKVVHPPPKDIDGSNVRAILPLACEYDMTHVVTQCEKYLESEDPCIANLLLAETYHLEKLCKRVEAWAVGIPLSDIKKEPGFGELKRTALTDILMQKVELGKP